MKPTTSGRRLALEVLCEWQPTGRPIKPIFEQALRRASLAPREVNLANTLINGILRQQQYLDHILARFSTHPLKKMQPRTLFALRMGIFQLLFLDRIPARAAVNETVKTLKGGGRPSWLVRFVNGVLRAIARAQESGELPGPETAGADGRPLLNHPDWLVRRWEKRYGPSRTRELCRANNLQPPLTLRVNGDREALLARLQEREIVARPGHWSPMAIVLPDGGGEITSLPGYTQGLFQVQDEAAQLATLLLPVVSGGSYLDGCAGLGGKTSLLAQRADNISLTAVEPDPHRFRKLRENLARFGLEHTRCLNTPLEEFATGCSTCFDGILLDAPCSGTGVIRRQPDIRWNRSEADLPKYHRLQRGLLDTAAPLLKPGGMLVYATCSLEEEENEAVVDAFLAAHTDFRVESAAEHLPAPGGELVDGDGFFHPTPAHGLDGFFAACLRKKSV